MWMVLLYGVATFMETGVGVWMFGRMFPERKSSSEYRWAKMILLTLLILTTYTMHREGVKILVSMESKSF